MIGRDEIALRILCHHNSVYITYLSYPPPFLTAVLFIRFLNRISGVYVDEHEAINSYTRGVQNVLRLISMDIH